MPGVPPRTKATLSRAWQWTKGMAPFVAATACGYRPVSNALRRRSLRIGGDGLYEHFAQPINAHDQWLLIRTHDVTQPILLYLHGGPGGAQSPQYRHYQLPWEAHFTVVHGDQRGPARAIRRASIRRP